MDGSRKTRDLYLHGMSAVYLFAFGSWFVQIPGLFGDGGILPVRNTLGHLMSSEELAVFEKPNAIWWLLAHEFPPQTSVDLVCLAGVVVSFLSLTFKSLCSMPVYFILWFLYFSLYEAGFLTGLVAPITPDGKKSPLHRLPFFLIKWLLFRLMFASGVVKLTSHCKTWWGLTALYYHFETQCIPTPMAWWAHQLPQWILRLAVVGTYVIEIALPFLLFSPVRRLRHIAVYGQVLLMFVIILSGNYNFFNFLTIALCLSAVDDNHLSVYGLTAGRRKDFEFGTKNFRKLKKFIASATTILVLAGFIYYTVQYFGLEFFEKGNFLHSKIEFDSTKFQQWVDDWTSTSIWIGAILFAYESIYTLYLCIRKGDIVQKTKETLKYICLFGMCTYLFSISMVPLKYNSTDKKCWPVVHEWHAYTRQFELVHSYGLFRSMTGVGGRPEVILYGANAAEGPWNEIKFLYKPGNESLGLPWIVPHQPRLDWQMWFAALGQYQHNPWFVSMVDKLMRGNKEVVQLLDEKAYPFKKSPPKYMKAELYLYRFTLITKSGGIPKRTWTRKYSHEYLPAISKDHGDLKSFLRYHGLETKSVKKQTPLCAADHFVQKIRETTWILPPHILLWSLWMAATRIMMSMMSKAK